MMEAIRQSVDRLDQRLTAMDGRIDQRFTALQAHMDERFSTIDGQFTALRAEMAHQFRWIMGVQVTVFVGITAAIISGFIALQ
jgi:hypothetical protein